MVGTDRRRQKPKNDRHDTETLARVDRLRQEIERAVESAMRHRRRRRRG
jgi:hypothetical protein